MNDFEQRLRAAMQDEASRVRPGERLSAVRRRTAGRSERHSAGWWVPALSGVAAVGLVATGVLVATGAPDGGSNSSAVVADATPDGSLGTSPTPTTMPTTDPTRRTPKPTEAPSTSTAATVPTPGSSGPPPPSVSPDATVRPTRHPSAAPSVPPSVTPPVTPSVTPPVTPPGTPTASPTATEAPPSPSDRSHVEVTSPSDGATFEGPVEVSGESNTFEATVSWRVLQDGSVVAEGYAMGGSYGEWKPFSFSVTLPAGSYTVEVFETSAKDGSQQYLNTRFVTVQ